MLTFARNWAKLLKMNKEAQLSHRQFTVYSDILDAEFRANEPKLRAALYPKRVESPCNYLNPRHYGVSASSMYRLWTKPSMNMLPHTTGMLVALALSKYQVPTYFVEPLFAEAVMQSRLPDDFYLNDIKWPMPAMLFVLPDAFVLRYFKHYIPFIGVARVPEGVYPEGFRPYPPTEHEIAASGLFVKKDRIMLHFPLFSTIRPATDYTGNYYLDAPISTIRDCAFVNAAPFEEEMFEAKHHRPVSFKPFGPQGEDEIKMQNDVSAFAVKLMLALTARPEYIMPERLARQENKNPRRQQEALYHPRMVGTPFRVLRPTAPAALPTGQKMPFHWRSGGWTHQVIGKRADFLSIDQLPRTPKGKVDWTSIPESVRERFWRSHKLIWIESYLVNAPANP